MAFDALTAEEYAHRKEQFAAIDKFKFAAPDSNTWTVVGDKLVLAAECDRPELVLPPEEMMGWFAVTAANEKKNLPPRLVIKFELEHDHASSAPKRPGWGWLMTTFGPGGTMADAISNNYHLMGKQKPSSVTKATVKHMVDVDLRSTHGKPLFVPQPLKFRTGRSPAEGEEGPPVLKFTNVKLPLSGGYGPPRAAGELPPEIDGLFPADHPVSVFFLDNLDVQVLPNVNLTVADGVASWPEIVAAASIKGSSQYFMKLFGTMRLGGINLRFMGGDRKLWLLGMYPNRPGGIKLMLLPPNDRNAAEEVDEFPQIYGKRKAGAEADEGDIYDGSTESKRACE